QPVPQRQAGQVGPYLFSSSTTRGSRFPKRASEGHRATGKLRRTYSALSGWPLSFKLSASAFKHNSSVGSSAAASSSSRPFSFSVRLMVPRPLPQRDGRDLASLAGSDQALELGTRDQEAAARAPLREADRLDLAFGDPTPDGVLAAPGEGRNFLDEVVVLA